MKYKIITPVATEPVTLAEAKLHLRLESETFEGDITTHQSIAPGSHDTAASYSLVGAAVDVLGSITIASLNAGTCGAGGSVAAKLQESEDSAEWTDVTEGAFTTVTEANDNAIQELAYTGGKQYVRVVATVAVTACSFSADIVTKTGDATEDALIADLITGAREHCEEITRRALATQTIEVYPEAFPPVDRLELPRPPLQSVTSVKYKDNTGTETTMTEITAYIADTESPVGQLVLPYGINWPSFTPYPVNPVKIRYVAGYSALNPLPKLIKQAMLLHIGYYYNNRDAVELDSGTDRAIRAMLSIYKAGWF